MKTFLKTAVSMPWVILGFVVAIHVESFRRGYQWGRDEINAFLPK